MVSGISGNSPSLDDLKALMEAAQQKRDAAEEAKGTAEADKASDEANKAAAEANKTAADTCLTAANAALSTAEVTRANAASEVAIANSELSGALNVLNSLPKDATEAQKTNAQAAVDRAKEHVEKANAALKEAEKAKEQAQNAYREAQEAVEKADGDLETASKELEDAISALQTAVDNLEVAEKELGEAKQAVADEETRAAEEAKATEQANSHDIEPMSEEEAIAQGYTVIKSVEDLMNISGDGKFILMCDIDLDGIDWTPIGSSESPFKGEFNGNGFDIKNLLINVTESEAENVGLFGVTENAVIHNVNLVDAVINGSMDFANGTSNVGLLVGLARGTQFDNITVSGKATGYASVGGLVGAINDNDTDNSSITNVDTNVDIESQYYAGGLVGYIYETASRDEDHRGITDKSLIIRNCSTSGSVTVGEEAAGGLIGEAGKTLITVDKCSSSMDINWNNAENDGDLSFLLETGRLGGLIGCVNGSYIAFCNCDYTGTINGDTEFKSDVYGWYMDDAQVTIYDLPDGLPVDDILNIDGLDGMKYVQQPDGSMKYECTVSTMTGLDKMVAMLKEHPEWADQIVFVVNFDFNAMDGAYDYSEYAQYGIVQEIYEDEDGNVHNDVYIDNEIDCETTFRGDTYTPRGGECDKKKLEPIPLPDYNKSMIPGLEKDGSGNYYVYTSEGYKEVNMRINADGQITDVTKRLTSSEVKFREYITEMVKYYQEQIHKSLKALFGFGEDDELPIINKAEYKKLLKKAEEKGGIDKLSKEEQLAIAVFEADYDVMNIVSKATNNMGCGMGGNASFLDKTTTYQMYTEDGRALYTNLKGEQLVQKLDENGKPIEGEYEYADGRGDYEGFDTDQIFEQRGTQTTDKDGNLLFTDKDGNTVTQIKDENGNVKYVTKDSEGNDIDYEGNPDELERQLTPYDNSKAYSDIENEVKGVLDAVNNGEYPKNRTSGTNDTQNTEENTEETPEETNDTLNGDEQTIIDEPQSDDDNIGDDLVEDAPDKEKKDDEEV